MEASGLGLIGKLTAEVDRLVRAFVAAGTYPVDLEAKPFAEQSKEERIRTLAVLHSKLEMFGSFGLV